MAGTGNPNWKKGQSGNPNGRPKDEVGPLARMHTREALERLVFWMKSKNPKASVTAALAILDRGYGKAPQSLEVTTVKTPDELKAEDERHHRVLGYLETILKKATE